MRRGGRIGLVLLVAVLAWALAAASARTGVTLRPGDAGWALLRGATAKGLVAERAALLLPGFDRRSAAALRLRVETAADQPVELELRVDGELQTRVFVDGPHELQETLRAAPVDALRLDLTTIGGPIRVLSVRLSPEGSTPWAAPAAAALFASVTLLLGWRAQREALPLALLAAALAALVAALPFGLATWPASWPSLMPALLLLLAGAALGLHQGGVAFVRDAALVGAFVFGAAVRVLFLQSTGSWDTEYWKAWMHRSREAGLTQAYGPADAVPAGHALAQYRGQEEAWKVDWSGRLFVVDYPPLSMALWAWSSRLVDAVARRLPAFERENVAVKLPALLGDLLALVVLPWAWRPRRRRGLELAALYWALPVSWLSSAVLGYFDGILPPLLVVALVAAGSGWAVVAGAILALATLVKPTAAIVAPAAALALWRARASLGRAAAAALGVSIVVFLPYAIDGTLVTALVHCARLFRQDTLSGGYPNAWWLVGHALTYARAHGFTGPVAFAPVRLLAVPARSIGTLLFALCAVHLVRRQPAGIRAACLSGALLFLAYGMVGVGVHENHPHPLFLLMLAAGLATWRLKALFAACATVYVFDMLALSGIGRFHGPRYLWLTPLAESAKSIRMALGFDLTLLLTLLHLAAFAAALAWAHEEAKALESEPGASVAPTAL